MSELQSDKSQTDGGLRERILHHATRLFATRGFSGTSMREITENCECTKPALYYYFASKEALFREVVRKHTERILELLRASLDSTGSARDRLHAGLDAMVDYCEREPLAMRLMQRMEISPEDNAPEIQDCVSRQLHLQFVAEMLDVGIRSGEVRTDLEPTDGALLLCGSMHFQFENAISSGEWDRQQMHRSIDLIFDGIAANTRKLNV